jgi:hypothetical protein
MQNLLILAEVMDKEPSLTQIWTEFGALILLGTGLTLLHRRLVLLLLPFIFLFAFGTLDELQAPDVGPAILLEAGRGYVVQRYLAVILALSAPVVALVAKRPKLTLTGLLAAVCTSALGFGVLCQVREETTAFLFCGAWAVVLIAMLVGFEASRFPVQKA